MHTVRSYNMPGGVTHLINKMLASPACTPDHILLTAEALDEMAKELPAGSHFIPSIVTTAAELRIIAPEYAHPRGKPHGDFTGDLTP